MFVLILILVCCTAQGLMDLKGILQSITRKDFIRAVIWFCENGRKKWRDECEKSGRKGLYRTTVIADTEHLTLGQFTNKLGQYMNIIYST